MRGKKDTQMCKFGEGLLFIGTGIFQSHYSIGLTHSHLTYNHVQRECVCFVNSVESTAQRDSQGYRPSCKFQQLAEKYTETA